MTEIHGPNGRLEGVTVTAVDEKRRPIAGTERYFECDTLLLSVGLIPENELSREACVTIDPITQGAIADDSCMTEIEGIFACGNVLHVHDLVDFVSMEAAKAGAAAADYLSGHRLEKGASIEVTAGSGVRYTVPQKITVGKDISLAFRVCSPSKDSTIEIVADGKVIKSEKHPRLHPAEMVWVKIEDNCLSDTSVLEVRVR